ncbi:MAG: TOPRIM nucleotidyl transferase/hydrolase domain-containing protein [Desulfobacter sp.]
MEYKEQYQIWCNPPEDANAAWYRKRGFEFEKILNACLCEDGLDPRSSYKAEGEQIDGSFFLDGSVFLLEAKWHKDALPASSIYQFKGKVDGKLTGTIGVFISMSGYSKDAVDALALGKSLNVILFGREDIDTAINGGIGFKAILKTKLRKAAEEGVVYFSSEVEQVTKDGFTTIEAFSYDSASETLVKHATDYDKSTDLVVVCEGQTDRELISLLATKILGHHGLSKKINIIVAMGKYTIPRVANAARNISTSSPVLIVTDSDGDIDKTKDMLNRGIELENWTASVPEPMIESWLPIDRDELRKSMRKGSVRKKLSSLIDDMDLDKLAKSDSSFKVFYDWVKNA